MRETYHHGNLRRALLDAALRLVQTESPKALTLRAVARLAGVSQTAPYRHFADKDALLAAVAEEGFRDMAAAMRQAIAVHDEPLARFRALGLTYVEFAAGHPLHFRLMFGRELADRAAQPSLAEAASETFALLTESVIECQRSGLVREGNPDHLAVAAWSTVHGLAALVVNGQLEQRRSMTTQGLADMVTATLYLGLAEHPPSSPPTDS